MDQVKEILTNFRAWVMAVVLMAAALWADVRSEIDAAFTDAGVEVETKCPQVEE